MTPLVLPMAVQYIPHMGRDLEREYLAALKGLNLAQMSRETGRSLRSLHSYVSGDRRITEPAAQELVDYLRSRSATFIAAAERVEAALKKEGENG